MGCTWGGPLYLTVNSKFQRYCHPRPLHNTGRRPFNFVPKMATILARLKRSVAAVTIDIVAAEAGKAALEARISTLKHERRRLALLLTPGHGA